MRYYRWAFALTALAVGFLPSAANAQTGSRQSAEVKFVQQQPGVPSAATLNIDYVNPGDPSAKPPAVRTVVEEFAEGAQIDTSVPERCLASDAQPPARPAAGWEPGRSGSTPASPSRAVSSMRTWSF